MTDAEMERALRIQERQAAQEAGRQLPGVTHDPLVLGMAQSIDDAVKDSNWYAALTVALSLPDICAWLDTGNLSSTKRYPPWFERWVLPKYRRPPWPAGVSKPPDHQDSAFWLTGKDAYALRCAFLHQGQDDITPQKARELVKGFLLVPPPGRGVVAHCNMTKGRLQLQIDLFARDIAVAARKWWTARADDIEVAARAAELLEWGDFSKGVRL